MTRSALPKILTGIDTVSLDRLSHSLETPRFMNRVFTEEEVSHCQHHPHKVGAFAARYAAKEAFVKAIGLGFFVSVVFSDQTKAMLQPIDVGIRRLASGKPSLMLSEKARKIAAHRLCGCNQLDCLETHVQWDVSLSHDHKQAMAVVMILTMHQS